MACKICKMPQTDALVNMLEAYSGSRVAKSLGVSKTTVNDHKRKCIGKSSLPVFEQTENQSLNWNGNTGVWNTGNIDTVLDGISHEAILEKFGHDPNKVAIRGVLRESHKEYWSRDLEQMLWKHSYSFAVERKTEQTIADVDAVSLMKQIDANKKRVIVASPAWVESTFVLDWADWQMAKKDGGGSAGLIERLQSAFDSAEERIRELRRIGRKLDELVIIGGGDLVEGCVIYPNQSYEIDDHRRGQIRNTVAMIIKGIKQLAPHFESVRVVVAPGNHGEHRIAGNRTTIGDNDDLLVFEMAQVGIESDPDYSHVSFEIAEREMSVVTNILGWVYGVTHGDVYGKSSGTGVRNKVFNWFKTMAANRHAVGGADVLVTHHFHHDAQEDWGNTLWVQCPTIDGGSHYFKEYSGHDTKPGMASWVVTREERFQDKQILR